MYYSKKSYSLLRELFTMNIRYTIILIEIKKRGIASIEKKTYNSYRNGISYKAEYIYSRSKSPINKISKS
jgi:hypothetical protein